MKADNTKLINNTTIALSTSGQLSLVVGILRGLSAALRCDGDEGFRGGTRGHGWRGPLIGGCTGCVGDRC